MTTTNREMILKANKYGQRLDPNDCSGSSWYSPILQVASDLGALKGIDLTDCPVVTGYRYGTAPASGISYNYADQRSERGLSMAAINGQNEVGSCVWFADRDRVEYTGILLPYTGSDGEPLILAFGFDQFDY